MSRHIFLFLLVFAVVSPEAQAHPLGASKDWDSAHAAHLLRRAGFGGTPEQIEYLVQLGRRGAVEYLVEFDRIPAEPIPIDVSYSLRRMPVMMDVVDKRGKKKKWRRMDEEQSPEDRSRPQKDDEQAQRIADRKQMNRVTRWWIETMVATPRPLQEKLVLFWHGHFTSGYREVKSSWAMYRQNDLFRQNAAGNFRDLLIAITQDPAMVLYLNTQQNRKENPNENFAREFLELFTIGPGHYTERDIKEAARAFTGIGFDRETGEPVFRRNQHDFGQKTFLGVNGDLGPIEIVDAVLKKKETAEFIVRKFWTYFAYENPDERLVRALAKVLRDNRYDLKPMLKAMFMCDAFYSEQAVFTQIKSPVELLVGTMRMLEIPAVDTAGMFDALRSLGQELMQPPTVKGWDGDEAWITPSSLFKRYNIVGGLVQGNDNPQGRRIREQVLKRIRETLGAEGAIDEEDLSPLQPQYDPLPALKKADARTPERVVDYFVSRLLQRRINEEQRRLLIDAFNEKREDRSIHDPTSINAILGLIHLIVSTPEYQLS